jgi:hypothetical protein
MIKSDIIKLAREATRVIEPDDHDYRQEIFDKEKFANLVAAAEREACAKLIEDYPYWLGTIAKQEIAAAIRARTTT